MSPNGLVHEVPILGWDGSYEYHAGAMNIIIMTLWFGTSIPVQFKQDLIHARLEQWASLGCND